MRLITTIEYELDLKSLLMKTSGTITRHVTAFLGEGHKNLPDILTAARSAKELIRNDADMTMRLIKSRPEREEEYKQAWAVAAEKQLMGVYCLVKEAFSGGGRTLRYAGDSENIMEAKEIDEWITPVPVQQEHPGAPLIP